MKDNNNIPSDALLTAYLDGELEPAARREIEEVMASEPAVRDRLAGLAGGDRPFRETFDALLEVAPRDRLNARLATAMAQSGAMAQRPHQVRWRWEFAAMAASLLLLAGVGVGFLLGQSPPSVIEALFDSDRWQQSVAEQVSLYGHETLASIDINAADQQVRLDRLANRMDIRLPAEAVALPGLSLKRVDLLQVGDRPLLQLVYQGAGASPLALCIIEESDEAGERKSQHIAGMNLIYWTAGRHGFLLVGSAPMHKIAQLADVVAARLPQ
jgi:anti-sigma factor RsiW